MLLTRKCIGSVFYMGGIPAVPEPFCHAWGQLIQYGYEYICGPGEYIYYSRATVSYHSFARNSIIEQAAGEWVVMLDCDHAPEPDLVCRLLTAANKYEAEVVTGLYCAKPAPHLPILYKWNENGTLSHLVEWPEGTKAFAVGSAGAGCLFIRRVVWERMRDELHENAFDIIWPNGEDHSFFKRCHRLGIKPLVVPAIENPHLRWHGVTMADFERGQVPAIEAGEVEGYQ